jgi:minichromosome maintenance protein 10
MRHFTISNPPLSPSPLRKSSKPPQMDGGMSDFDDDDDDDDDDDEELLKLKVERIEAMMKLKRLQKQQKKKFENGAAINGAKNTEPNASQEENSQPASVQVPVSPTARRVVGQPPASPKSPSRILLGIDKGLTGRDISLRRAPQYRNGRPQPSRAPSPRRPVKTFSQRLAEERSREKAKFEKQRQIEKSRSKGFAFLDDPFSENNNTSGTLSTKAAQNATFSFRSAISSSDQTLQSANASSLQTAPRTERSNSISVPTAQEAKEETTDEAGFDSYSGLHLLRRTTPHTMVCRHLTSKKIFQLPQLLKTVVSPTYEAPDVEGDWVVLGVISSKSEPRNVGQNTTANKTGKKYMVMQLTDLKWEIDLFLFGTGFKRFWKLPLGTIIALLNPGIMKPRNADSGRFSLTIPDDGDDNVLEIGVARDLGFCKSLKRDGKECSSWVDIRHTHFCNFHVEHAVSKARTSRPEVNSMSRLFSPPKNGGVRPKNYFGGERGVRSAGGANSKDSGLLHEGPMPDLPQRLGGAGGNVYIAPGRSTASLLDDEDYLAGRFHRGTKEERLMKRLEDSKQERDLTKRIIQAQGREGGIGTQYLKTRLGDTASEKEKFAAAREKEVVATEKAMVQFPSSTNFIFYIITNLHFYIRRHPKL